MAQTATKSEETGASLEAIVPVKVGNGEFMGGEKKPSAKERISNTADNLLDSYKSHNPHPTQYHWKMAKNGLKELRGMLEAIYESELRESKDSKSAYSFIDKCCKNIYYAQSAHGEEFVIQLANRLVENYGQEEAARTLKLILTKFDYNEVMNFSTWLPIKAGMPNGSLPTADFFLRELKAIGRMFENSKNPKDLRYHVFHSLPNSEKALGCLGEPEVEKTIEKLISSNPFICHMFLDIVAAWGANPAMKYARVILSNKKENRNGDPGGEENGHSYRVMLKDLSDRAVKITQRKAGGYYPDDYGDEDFGGVDKASLSEAEINLKTFENVLKKIQKLVESDAVNIPN
ncbi:MAG: hypothetical protein NTX79_02995 [Candidatus Micrarchaeota archaeon]|nr:hypothetical protein [Candidatus Micrarchaeota archaeon]